MKKFIYLIVLFILPTFSFAYDAKINGIYYNLVKKTKTAEVAKGSYTGAIKIPASFNYDGIDYSVTSIEPGAFSNCKGLTSISLPNSLTSIGYLVFAGCKGLTSIEIPYSVTSIGSQAFYRCTGLTSISLPNSVTSIESYTFYHCTNLTSISLPISVKSIQSNAFSDCPEIMNVYCYAEIIPSTDSDIFDQSLIEYATLYVPKKSIDDYKNHEVWGQFGTIFPLSGEQQQPQQKEKCSAPSISLNNGELTFSCDTDNSEIQYNYKIEESVSSGSVGTKPIKPIIKITVNAWATAEGYDTSDTTTVTFEVNGSGVNNVGDVNKDGKVDISDIVAVINIIAGK